MSSLSPNEKNKEESLSDSKTKETTNSTTEYQWTPQKKLDQGTFTARGIPAQNIECNDYTQTGCLRLSTLDKMPADTLSGFLNEKKKDEPTNEAENATVDQDSKTTETPKISKFLVLYNPVSGKGASKRVISSVLVPLAKSHGHTIFCWESTSTQSMGEYLLSNQDTINNEMAIDTFIVVGGDGTFKDFVNGYIGGKYAQTVIYVSGGTGNSLTRSIGIFSDDSYLERVISGKGEVKKLSCLKMTDKEGKIMYASSMVYWGVPSDSAENSNNPFMRNVFGGARYDICAVYQILKFSSRFVTLNIDDGKYMIDLDLIVFAALNGKYFGKGLMICPFAKMDSEFMDLGLLCRTSRMGTAALFNKLPTGESCLNSSYDKNGILYIRCKKCELIPYQGLDSFAGVDGEVGLKTPILIEVVPNLIPLLV